MRPAASRAGPTTSTSRGWRSGICYPSAWACRPSATTTRTSRRPPSSVRAAPERPDSGLGGERAAGGRITGALVTELAHDGDPAAVAAVADVGRWLGVGLTGIANALDPEVIVIGGGVIAAGALLLEPARAE